MASAYLDSFGRVWTNAPPLIWCPDAGGPDGNTLIKDAEFGLSLALPPQAKIHAAMAELDAQARAEDETVSAGFADDDDFYSIVMKASRVLEAAGAEFTMSGFGNPRWPLDLSYDGSMIIEDLPDFMGDLVDLTDGAVTLHLCGQGVETDLVFETAGEDLRITCVSRAPWIDRDIVHHVSEIAVLLMFDELARSFALGLEMMDTEVAGRPPFVSWKRPLTEEGL
ncbi:hypothetical protein ACQEU3_44630 [Spirillospora sp. CA-253888]